MIVAVCALLYIIPAALNTLYIHVTYYTPTKQARSIRRAQDVRKQLVTIMDRYAAEWMVRIMTNIANHLLLCTFFAYIVHTNRNRNLSYTCICSTTYAPLIHTDIRCP